MRRVWMICLLGGCSLIGNDRIRQTCTRAPPAIDSVVALAGLTVAVASTRDVDADARAHGQVDFIHMTITLPSLVYAVSALYGFVEASKCSDRSAR